MATLGLSSAAVCCQSITMRMTLTNPSALASTRRLTTPAPRGIHTICRAPTIRSTSPLAIRNKPCTTVSIARSSGAFFTTTARRGDATPVNASQQQKPTITWDDFLKLRRRRRYVNLVASVGTAAASVAVAVPMAMQYELEDRIASISGLDPFIAFGLMITAVGGFGWLMGPFVGNAGFLLWNRSIRGEIAKRERDFYNHIKRFRADPTSSSVSNPVPDYYGEKIGSVADYRRWLKDQRAFNRKKSKNLL